MQAITHFLTGVAIEQRAQALQPSGLRWAAVAGLGIVSHGLLDRLARLTYHPPDARWHDPFWVAFHVPIFVGSAVVLVRYWKHYKWGMLFASLPDFDWVLIKPLQLVGVKLEVNGPTWLHRIAYSILDTLPILRETERIPTRTDTQSGVVLEAALLLGLWWLIRRGQRPPKAIPSPTSPTSQPAPRV